MERSMTSDQVRIAGVLSPVVTPFNADLSPDPDQFVRQCKWLLSQNVGLAVFGTNSEANSLAIDEKMALLEKLVSAGVDPSRMMPGTGHCAITDSVKLTAHAVKLGCAGVLMLPPFYYKGVTDEGLYRNFAEIIERVGAPGRRGGRRAAGEAGRDPSDVREVPDDPGAEGRNRALRRRRVVVDGAPAAGRADAGAIALAGRGPRRARLHDARLARLTARRRHS